MHAKVFTPSIFIAHDPHTPSRQERRSVNVESTLFLIQSSASRTIGPQSSWSTSYVSKRGFSPLSGFHRYTANVLMLSDAPSGAFQCKPFLMRELAGKRNSTITAPLALDRHINYRCDRKTDFFENGEWATGPQRPK